MPQKINVLKCSPISFQCVVCLCAKATMQTFPCGHKVVCRKCFVKTIQVAVSQRCLPLKCVVCRTRVLKLKQSGEEEFTPPASRRGLSSPGRQSSGSRLLARLFSNRNNQPPQPSQVSSSGSATSLGSTLGDSQPLPPSPCIETRSDKTQRHGSTVPSHQRQAQPVVATKLMQPWLIYPSMSSPKQQRAFLGDVPEEAPLRNYAAPPSSGSAKDMQKGHIQLRPSGPFSPAQRRPKHHCSPVTSSRIAEIKHAHMLSPRVPRCAQCIQQQKGGIPVARTRNSVAD
jgi:hypothetical protein